MGMKEELEVIREGTRLVADVKATIQNELDRLTAGSQRGVGELPYGRSHTSDYVARRVMTKDELEGLYAELENSERKLARRAGDLRARLEAVFADSPKKRMVIDLYYLKGMTNKSVAHMMSRSTATCMRLKADALEELHRAEADHGDHE